MVLFPEHVVFYIVNPEQTWGTWEFWAIYLGQHGKSLAILSGYLTISDGHEPVSQIRFLDGIAPNSGIKQAGPNSQMQAGLLARVGTSRVKFRLINFQ